MFSELKKEILSCDRIDMCLSSLTTASQLKSVCPRPIERKLLCPFQYFGVTDTVDLDALRWARGGYDRGDLNKVYTGNDARAKHVITSLDRYVTDLNEVKGLGFCVSIEHAGYMAKFFNHFGIPAMALSALSGDQERNSAKRRLASGEIKFIFVVDLYNEGVDIPQVNTIMFLRPTESLTVFLQQLGRGLRLQNECLFHWQSQSTTAEHSPTGQRYINHRKNGGRVVLFVREFKNDAAGAAPYTFLGLAQYVQHTGTRPMSIVWRLDRPIPARFLKKTNKMVVG